MVNKKRFGALLVASFLGVPGNVSAAEQTQQEPNFVRKGQTTKILGAKAGGEITAGNPEATQTIGTTANVTVLGKSLSALDARVMAPATIGGVTYNEVYSFGKRVFSNAFYIKSDGFNQIHAGLTPTEIRVPFVVYPVGPLTLEIGGGARFQAEIIAMLTPEIGIPIETSTLGVQIMALAQAAGFVEAYARLLFIRGGVGGQLDLIDGHLDVNGKINFDGNKPVVLVSGIVEFLKGRIYAFVDIFGFLRFGWTRLVDHELYAWRGYCFSMGNISCPAK